MYPTETRGAAARRQSDRPPSIDDDGDAEAPPRRAHGITAVFGGPIRQVLLLALAGVVVGVVVRWEGSAEPTAPQLSIRGGDPAWVLSRRQSAGDERFTVYLVGSAEEAELLRRMIDGDVAEVRVIATDEQAAEFHEALVLTNRVRMDMELPEISVIDLRTGQ